MTPAIRPGCHDTAPLLGPAFASQTVQSFHDYVTSLYKKPSKRPVAGKAKVMFVGKQLEKPAPKKNREGLYLIRHGAITCHVTFAKDRRVSSERIRTAARHLAADPKKLRAFFAFKKFVVDPALGDE